MGKRSLSEMSEKEQVQAAAALLASGDGEDPMVGKLAVDE
jgi:hypothetical protein